MENLIPIGVISKIHGYKGSIKADINFQGLKINKGDSLFLEINKKPVPFLIEELKSNGGDYFLKFDDIENSVDAEELLGLTILIKSNKKIEESENYKNIIGYKIIEQNEQFVGNVISIIARQGQDLLEIEFEGKTYFLPCAKQIILKINHNQKSIFTEIPDGIISLNN